MEYPILKDWLGILEIQIRNKGQSKEDLTSILLHCEEQLQDMAAAFAFLDNHRSTINQWFSQYQQLYIIRFGEGPPHRPVEESPEHLQLDTAAKRKEVVRDISLRATEPGQKITDKEVLEAIESKGMRFVASNPAAAISTILYGFTSEFQKVEGESGSYRRLESGS